MDDDPCVTLQRLEARKTELLLTGAVKVQRFRTASGQEEEVQFASTDMKALDAEIARYRDLCARSKGKRGSRFAIRAG